ncbi:MAG: DUF4153 domain-containing protein [Thermoguttaceae bacterium]
MADQEALSSLAGNKGPTPAEDPAGRFAPVEVIKDAPVATKVPWDTATVETPLRWRELLAIVLIVALCDVTIFRGLGFAGYALLFCLAPGLLWLGSPRPRLHASFWAVGAMLLLLAVRLAWLGEAWEVAVGFALVAALALALAGQVPHVLDVLACVVRTPVAGYLGLTHYERSARGLRLGAPRIPWLNVVLPLAAIGLFGTLFVLANPDLVKTCLDLANRFFRWLGDWLGRFAPTWWELVFWIAATWTTIGLLRPVWRHSMLSSFSKDGPRPDALGPTETPLYAALRNTLVAVIGLFAVYLGFEFKTLWFREFPQGFYYAGYAHEGAAWLTVALLLATVVLSLIFRGPVLGDPRLPRLRRLAWLWSLENLVLAVAVYNRLSIYIGFNGMTRMRTIGLFGMSAVAVGFILVVWKIAYSRDFVWLLRRHLWTLAAAVYLYALTPVDTLVHTYNVSRVLGGQLAPSVQIITHPVNAEGILVLHPLVHCDDPIIREGIRALLAEHAVRGESLAHQREQQGWTTFQLADRLLLQKLHALQADWAPYADPTKRAEALGRFHKYAYQWY